MAPVEVALRLGDAALEHMARQAQHVGAGTAQAVASEVGAWLISEMRAASGARRVEIALGGLRDSAGVVPHRLDEREGIARIFKAEHHVQAG